MEAIATAVAGDALLKNGAAPACLLPEAVCGDMPGELVAIDVEIAGGRISRIRPAGQASGIDQGIDLDGGLILPALVDMHTHLDKGHIWERKPNPDGSFMGALTAVGEDRAANWSADDVRARMTFGLKCAYAHGTAAIRTHLDSIPPQDAITWPVFAELRQEWAGRIALQGACLFGIERLDEDPNHLIRMADLMAETGGILGAVTYMIPGLETHLDAIFAAAKARGLDLDFHVDETLDPDAVSLRLIAEAALRAGFEGKIVCGHCCSLSRQPDDAIDRTLDLVAAAGIGIVSLPLCNMYLQDRNCGRTPRFRGVTLLHEMKHRGIPVAVASDNTRDPFYAYGDLDLIEVYAQATRIAHFDHPVGDWIKTVSTAPAEMLRLDFGRLSEGALADMMVFRARSWSELLSRPAGPRTVLRAGQTLARTLPDYRELDHLMHERELAT